MLKEHAAVRQVPGEPRRRWFTSEQFDLILWLNDDENFAGFELCYDRKTRERALIWRPDSGYSHMAIDDGELRGGKHKATPILTTDGHFDAARIRAAFLHESRTLPTEVAVYVLALLEAYPEAGSRK